MKSNLIKSKVLANRWNFAIVSAAVCLVWVAFISGAAQLKNDKRITAVQLGSAAEGARVTLVSDEGLNDYEAFRRGERFYVRIPSAQFAAAKPGFHGDGFDDVQVQKVGDSVVVSFKLQPGASARVDQHGNRLQVIFTSLARTQRPGLASGASNRATVTNANPNASQTNLDRQRDAAGPVPIDSPSSSRERFVSQGQSARGSSQRQPTPGATTDANSRAKNSPSPTATPTPMSSVSPLPQQNYPAWTSSPVATATPATSTSRSGGFSTNSSSPRQTASGWFAANRKTALVGTLIVGSLAVLLAVFLYRRPRSKAAPATVGKPGLSQPKYSTDRERDMFSPEPPAEVAPSSSEAADAFASETEETPAWRRAPIEPAFAPAHVASANGSANSTPSPGPVVVANGEASNEEREVFEL